MFVLPVFLALLATCQCKIEFSERARNFSVELLYYTAEETQWHTVISPLGIWSLLTAVSTGASGKTKEQLLHTLILPKKQSNIVSEYKDFMKSAIPPQTVDVRLKCNNFLFLDKSFTAESEFTESMKKDFSAKVGKLDFKSSTDAANTANWAINRYDTSVSNVFQPDDFNDARMILTNTISFKGNWQYPFNASETRLQDFYDVTGNVIGKVNMMQQQGNFEYSNLKKIQAFVLELPYGETNQYSFLAVLPYPNVKLETVYRGLESLNLKDIFNQMKVDTEEYGVADVVVNLPRFKISTNVILNTPLIHMNLVDIFDPVKANFDLVSKTESLYVSAIVHNADIQVTETGTTASSATSAFYADRSLPSNFNANRPFLYFIIEKSTMTIVFSGAYSKPVVY